MAKTDSSTAQSISVLETVNLGTPLGMDAHFYSARKASIGSRRDAFLAGNTPASRPMMADKVNPPIANVQEV